MSSVTHLSHWTTIRVGCAIHSTVVPTVHPISLFGIAHIYERLDSGVQHTLKSVALTTLNRIEEHS
jgi:hypothetical protein